MSSSERIDAPMGPVLRRSIEACGTAHSGMTFLTRRRLIMDTEAQGSGVTHRCDFCEEAFSTQQELEQHVKEQHAEIGDLSVPEDTGGSKTEGGAGMVQSE